jgi:hypothetical protein
MRNSKDIERGYRILRTFALIGWVGSIILNFGIAIIAQSQFFATVASVQIALSAVTAGVYVIWSVATIAGALENVREGFSLSQSEKVWVDRFVRLAAWYDKKVSKKIVDDVHPN